MVETRSNTTSTRKEAVKMKRKAEERRVRDEKLEGKKMKMKEKMEENLTKDGQEEKGGGNEGDVFGSNEVVEDKVELGKEVDEVDGQNDNIGHADQWAGIRSTAKDAYTFAADVAAGTDPLGPSIMDDVHDTVRELEPIVLPKREHTKVVEDKRKTYASYALRTPYTDLALKKSKKAAAMKMSKKPIALADDDEDF